MNKPEAYRKPPANPLGEFGGVGEYKHLNDDGGADFGGVEGMADREADKALGEFAGLGKKQKLSSLTGPEKVSIPNDSGTNPLGG